MSEAGRPAPEGLTDTPAELAEAARLHLREKFLRAKVGISGANFMVAETGTLMVVESEGNGRMCLTLPETLISVVGIEKIVPTWQDLEVFLQTLPRSSTAERTNPYTSMWTGTTEEDGPQTFHLVLIDNGRTDTLADEVGRQALRCIRCSACLNVCRCTSARAATPTARSTPARSARSSAPTPWHRKRDRRLAPVRLLALRCLLRGLPGRHRHPGGPRPPVRERIAEGGQVTREGQQGRPQARQGARAERAAMRAARWAFSHPGALRTGQRFASRTRRFHPRTLPGPRQGVERHPGSPDGPRGTVPRLVGRRTPAERTPTSERRDLILGRVRRALADVPRDDTPYEQAIERGYLREHGSRSVEETVDLLAENLADYRALVHRCAADELRHHRRAARRTRFDVGGPAGRVWTLSGWRRRR